MKKVIDLSVSEETNTTESEKLFETPKVKLQGSYLYAEELKTRLDVAIREVELYMDGKAEPQYEQASMEFPADGDVDFENAKLN